MGLSLRSPLPDPQDEIERLQRVIYEQSLKVIEAQEEARTAKRERDQVIGGVANLRIVLAPLYGALQRVFGEADAMGVADSPVTSGLDPRKAAVWEDWKKKLGGKAADAIDALHIHGEMTHTQLKIHMKCGQQTVYDTVHRLNKAGIINKNGGKVSLKVL